jgi:hypothetical protein
VKVYHKNDRVARRACLRLSVRLVVWGEERSEGHVFDGIKRGVERGDYSAIESSWRSKKQALVCTCPSSFSSATGERDILLLAKNLLDKRHSGSVLSID